MPTGALAPHAPFAAALGDHRRQCLAGVGHSPRVWAVDSTGTAGQEVLSGLEFAEDGQVELCRNPGCWPPGLLGVLGIFPSRVAPPSGRGRPFCRVTSGGGESQACKNESFKD